MTNRNYYNEVVKLENGMLSKTGDVVIDFSKKAANISAFDKYLQDNGVDFVYVQAPYKLDLAGELQPTGLENTANVNAEALLSALGEMGVSSIDLRRILSADAEAVEKYFYDTDHHWNNDGAFCAFGVILEYIARILPNSEIDLSYADVSNWETTVYEDRFLGSLGKRVGIYYGGIDDYTLYTPKFETDMYMYVGQKTAVYAGGSFVDANVRKELYLDGDTDYFGHNTYCSYIGGDYPIVTHKNLNVQNGVSVMIIKDSFTLPVQAFLSTAVERVDVIDPRHLNSYSIAECVEMFDPDVVIMMMNPSIMADERYYKFGIENGESLSSLTQISNVIGNIASRKVISKEDKAYTYTILFDSLEYNSRYLVEIEDINVIQGEVEALGLALYDGKTRLWSTNIYIEQDGKYYWDVPTPTGGSAELKLLMYAGEIGQTEGKGVEVTGIKLYRMLSE